MNDWQQRELLKVLQRLENVFISHVDGRDLLQELNPLHWHHCDIVVRINGQDKMYEGDWLKRVWWVRQRARALLSSIDPDDDKHMGSDKPHLRPASAGGTVGSVDGASSSAETPVSVARPLRER